MMMKNVSNIPESFGNERDMPGFVSLRTSSVQSGVRSEIPKSQVATIARAQAAKIARTRHSPVRNVRLRRGDRMVVPFWNWCTRAAVPGVDARGHESPEADGEPEQAQHAMPDSEAGPCPV